MTPSIKTIKAIIAAIAGASLLSLSLLALAGCAATSSEDAIRQAVSQELDIYKNMDEKAVSMVAESAENEGLTELGIDGREFAKAVLDGFDYRINDIVVNDKTATANVTIISKSMSDFETKFNDAVSELMSSAATSDLSTENVEQTVGSLAMETFGNTDIIEEDVELQFELEGNTWVSTNVAEALGNLDSMVFAN